MPAKTRSNSAPRRARPLTRERITSAALKLADDRGDFSMRALGSCLRVDPMAIYRHFRDKEALLDAIVDVVLTDLHPPGPETGPPVEQLRQMCRDLRCAISRHPGIGLRASAMLLTLGPHSLELTDAALDLLIQIGLLPDEAGLAYLALVRFVSGIGSAEDQLHAAGQTEAEWRKKMRTAYAAVSLDSFPRVSQLAETLGQQSFDDQFEFGIDSLLAGFVANARSLT